MTRIEFTPAAVGDLDRIYDYSADRWGEPRAESYVLSIRSACVRVGGGRVKGRPVAGHVGLLRYTVKSHVVFYRLRTGGIDVVRILHSRQDPDTNLTD